jgi:hypothetical protein
MTVIKKSDVKNHLANRYRNRNGIHLYTPASQPDATGFSGEQTGHADSNAINTVEESRNASSPSGQETLPAKTGHDASGIVTASDSKSAQA